MIKDASFKDLSRRDFLKKTGQAALSISGGVTLEALLSSCATITFKEQAPVIYPRLKGHKVQPPENGCFIGFYGGEGSYSRWGSTHQDANTYACKVGKKPKIMIIDLRYSSSSFFPTRIVEDIAAEAIPFVYRDLTNDIARCGFRELMNDKCFREGLEEYARDIIEFGRPIFFSTMREMNSSRRDLRPWKGRLPGDVKKLWKYMWQIFEDNGANEYATWVWEIIPPENRPNSDDLARPDVYFPGDKYVDWIGLSTWSHKAGQSATSSLSTLSVQTYREMRINHPSIPVMWAEIGKYGGTGQAAWLRSAYQTIKSLPGNKAAIYWEISHSRFESRLTEESVEALREIFKDPDFIGAS